MVKKRYTIAYAEGIEEDLAQVRAYDQVRILDKIDEQLIYEPGRETRNKKMLVGLVPSWDSSNLYGSYASAIIESSTMWTPKTLTVTIQAIRFKPPDKTTEDILW